MTVTLQRYEMQLRRNQHKERLDPFSRTVDLDDPAQLSTVESLLVKLLADAVKRSGGKISNLHEYDLQLRKAGSGHVELTFVAHVSEVDERDR
ncbi:hypothetical protein [Dactylosporangium sp. CA-139066]|uniref:hypothetical protein n=1 Tax=Dactylosporangium sp. CA-139066 TaxID=3239930 RepID=UPI003D8B1817